MLLYVIKFVSLQTNQTSGKILMAAKGNQKTG